MSEHSGEADSVRSDRYRAPLTLSTMTMPPTSGDANSSRRPVSSVSSIIFPLVPIISSNSFFTSSRVKRLRWCGDDGLAPGQSQSRPPAR